MVVLEKDFNSGLHESSKVGGKQSVDRWQRLFAQVLRRAYSSVTLTTAGESQQRLPQNHRRWFVVLQRDNRLVVAGGDLDSTGLLKRTLHVVVGQLAT